MTSPFSIITLYLCLTSAFSLAKIIDLSHVQRSSTFMSPGGAPYNRTTVFAGQYSEGIYVEFGDIYVGEHGGTHIDAPRHFIKDGLTIDKIPIENLILNGVMIDCSTDVKGNINYQMSRQKLEEWETQNGRIPDGAGVIVNFGWSSRFNDHASYVNSTDFSTFDIFTYPTVSIEAAEFLLNKRNLKLLAVDTGSPDMTKYPVHVLLLTAGRTIVENVRDPGRLPARGFRLHAVPVAYEKGSGIQIRFYAITTDDEYFKQINGGQSVLTVSILTVVISFVLILLF